MKRDLFRPIIALGFAVLAIGSAQAQSFNYASVDFPNATRTRAWGINPGGVIVGDYRDASNVPHGFVLSGGHYITLDVPGSVLGLMGTLPTNLRAINPAGDIVGFYIAPPNSTDGCTAAGSPPCLKGFLLRHGTFSTVLFPGHEGSIPARIAPNGSIYACYHDADLMGSMFGFARIGRTFTSIDMPASMHTGATPDGNTIVGLYSDMTMMPAVTRGYVLQNGNFQPFDVPNGTPKFTEAWDINPDGNIVGDFQDGVGMFHGFLRIGNEYTVIDFPAATGTHAQGINAQGAIVGTYTDTNKVTHGFLAVPVAD
jgi:probable HAF family extracellular repeat protein